MRRLIKIISWTSIVLIFLLIIAPIVIDLMPLEFTSDDDKLMFENIRFWGMPLAILLTLTGTLKKKDTAGIVIGKIVLTAFVSLFSFFIMLMTASWGLCRWGTDKVLFENKHNSSTKIVLRSYGCGAVDSGSPTYGVFKIKKLPMHLIWVTKIDTTQIDKTLWKQVDNKEE